MIDTHKWHVFVLKVNLTNLTAMLLFLGQLEATVQGHADKEPDLWWNEEGKSGRSLEGPKVEVPLLE